MGVAGWRRELTGRWRRSSPRAQDALVAAATFVVGLALDLIGLVGIWADFGLVDGVPTAAYVVLLGLGCLAMLPKRRHPGPALAAGAAVFAADLALGGSIALVLVLFDLLFTAGLHGSARLRAIATTAVFVVIGTASVVGGLALRDVRAAVFIGLQLTTLLFVPLWWAANLRQQRELGELTAEQAAREAVEAERAAMARDLHDVIAAHLSTTAIHSGAALARPPDTDRDRAALQAVRTSSVAALEEMRAMILLLRADGRGARETVAAAGLDRLPELLDAASADGLRVETDVGEVADLPALVDHAAYRIVHEAFTNVRKHAPEARVHVRVRAAGDHVTVTVANTLTSGDRLDHRALSAGTGLATMRERAGLLGGELVAGPDRDQWVVRATLPLPPRGAPVGERS
ncbi:MAG: two-component sensor histidine kinase [Hamadaea sp.]|nr:two-component sensor histidine kinase [Hamadaea sp.]